MDKFTALHLVQWHWLVKAGIPLLVLPGHIITREASKKLIADKGYIVEKLASYPFLKLST